VVKPRIKPGKNKVLVCLYNLTNPYIHLPDEYKKPALSVAEIIDGNGAFIQGQKVLVPTKAGLDIRDGKNKHRLININDIVASIINEEGQSGKCSV